MREKIRRYLMMAILCFSCILLFKSENKAADGKRFIRAGIQESETDKENTADTADNRAHSGRILKIYLDGKSYIAVDILFFIVVMGLLFLLVLERR